MQREISDKKYNDDLFVLFFFSFVSFYKSVLNLHHSIAKKKKLNIDLSFLFFFSTLFTSCLFVFCLSFSLFSLSFTMYRPHHSSLILITLIQSVHSVNNYNLFYSISIYLLVWPKIKEKSNYKNKLFTL